ncbi:deoxyribodipyrimidine photo-lyase [Betaproteobacteria bacterium SCN2]|jgi:deoxyribodipyrimidine photo-lyase|nr:deoxyribodipyrimidine photo-lyase [Betaproteobacteria bacterium SCN2]
MIRYDNSIVWLRRDLRLHDHAALDNALQASRQVRVLFVFDTDILDALPSRRDRRVEFIHGSVAALKADLEALGATLHVLHGAAPQRVPEFARAAGAQAVFCSRDYEPAAIRRDAAVQEALAGHDIAFHDGKDQVVFERDEVLTQSGRPYTVFTPYKNAWLRKLRSAGLAHHAPGERLERLAQEPPVPLPPLESLGFVRTNLAELGVRPGEAGARALFEDFLARIGQYKAARDYPAVRGPSYLSVHLRFGTLSIRELVATAQAIGGAGAETWLSELIWREFYQQTLWHRPDLAEGRCFKPEFDAIRWPNPAGHFEAWREARTGYPLVDAAMRQLDRSGYMHNRLRMVTASFLAKDLLVDWRLGERHFAEKLIDFDLASNSGGWQWAASVGCDAQPWFRIFNPVTQSEKFDPQGRFIRRYLPELSKVPDKYIHAPWTMPQGVQAECGVTIGRDYPAPVVEHKLQRERALALYKAASAGKARQA